MGTAYTLPETELDEEDGIVSAREAAIQAMQIILWEDYEQERTTITVRGAIDPYTPLPAEVSFYFVEDYELGLLEQVNFDTGEMAGEISHRTSDSDLEDFENLTKYSFILTEHHAFSAGLSIGVSFFDFEEAMGGLPIASFTFVPPNDLYGLVIGFVSPDYELVGAGTDIVLIGETDEGEVYGVIREDVPGGELQEFVVAFGLRETRDAALAAAAEASEETTPTALDWFTTPTGMIIAGGTVVLVIAIAFIAVLILRQKKTGADDGDDDGSDIVEDEDVDSSEGSEGSDISDVADDSEGDVLDD